MKTIIELANNDSITKEGALNEVDLFLAGLKDQIERGFFLNGI